MSNIAKHKNGSHAEKTNSSKIFTQKEVGTIEEVAYQLFVERGYEHGCDQEDWIKAEKIVRG